MDEESDESFSDHFEAPEESVSAIADESHIKTETDFRSKSDVNGFAKTQKKGLQE
jgi:hypothetical protein